MSTVFNVEVYRARPNVSAGPTVHILRSRLDFALVAYCGTLLAEVLAEVATATLDVLRAGDRAARGSAVLPALYQRGRLADPARAALTNCLC